MNELRLDLYESSQNLTCPPLLLFFTMVFFKKKNCDRWSITIYYDPKFSFFLKFYIIISLKKYDSHTLYFKIFKAFLKAWRSACNDTQSPTLVVPSQNKFLLSQILFQGPCKSSIHVQVCID